MPHIVAWSVLGITCSPSNGRSFPCDTVPAASIGWSISGIIFDNVNIDVQPQNNTQIAKVENNVFRNGGRGSIMSAFGTSLHIGNETYPLDPVNIILISCKLNRP